MPPLPSHHNLTSLKLANVKYQVRTIQIIAGTRCWVGACLVNNVVGGWVGLLYNMLCSTGSIRVKEVLARLTSVMENVVGSSARTSTAWLHNMLWSRAPSTWGHSHGNLSHLNITNLLSEYTQPHRRYTAISIVYVQWSYICSLWAAKINQ